MNEADRSSLVLAIAAHGEWLEERGIRFLNPDKPDESLAPKRLSAEEVRRVVATHRPQRLVGAVMTNLCVFCSLRVRLEISAERAKNVGDLKERLANSSEYLSAEEKVRTLKLVTFGHQDGHIQSVGPALIEAAKRARTARRKLGDVVKELEGRQRTAAKLGLPNGDVADVALAEWTRARCEDFEDDLAFQLLCLEGQQFAPEREPFAKAWSRAKKSALARLLAAGADSAQRRALFPGEFPKPSDRDENRQQIDRESRSRKRAKKR
ncbi:MAG TPA: hypothetical protein VFK05_09250 [Polyangiaceae bacterium]|nr:hypothetical protein [Polyangiaceae bacterium]